MSELINMFPIPSSISVEIDNEIKDIIKNLIEKKELNFHKILEYISSSIENKDFERSVIASYYCSNIVINDKYNLNKYEKIEILNELMETMKSKFENF